MKLQQSSADLSVSPEQVGQSYNSLIDAYLGIIFAWVMLFANIIIATVDGKKGEM